MKKFLPILLMALMAATSWAQFPHVTLRQIQEVPQDSLLLADQLQNVTSRWTLQRSPYYGDTVTVTALCVVPPKVLNWNVGGWTMLLYDTAAVDSWGGLLVMARTGSDSVQLLSDGFLNVQAGDVINMTGVVAEYPTPSMYSGSEFFPLPGQAIEIIGSHALPKPITKNIGDFYQGIFPGGKTMFSTGEPFEDILVEFHNLTIDSKFTSSTGRYVFSAVDIDGNEVTLYDASKYFTTAARAADSTWSKKMDSITPGLRIDTMRGYMTTTSGQSAGRGYLISPVYPGDIVFSALPAPPLASTHRRNPVVVSRDSTPTVSVRVTQQLLGTPAKTVTLYYSANDSAFVSVPMAFRASDTTYVAQLPKEADSTTVRYFIETADSLGQVTRYANSSTSGGISRDTSKGFFFYTVLDRPLTIRDVQYTPYLNGRSPYIGAVTPLSGIITADTAHIAISPLTNGSTSAWYMQSTSAPWSGIWLATSDTAAQKLMSALRNGDSVTVTGTVNENFEVTRLENITSVTKISSGNPEPLPVVLPTGAFSGGNGSRSAEPYEGMLVRFNNVTITSVYPTYSDATEWAVNDGSGQLLVQQSGKYSYSNVTADTTLHKTLLLEGQKISSLTGIMYYSFNYYKFVPRTDADFGTITSVPGTAVAMAPSAYALEQNYPNPFNPTTTISFSIPKSGMTTLKVYNVIGQEVATLVNGVQSMGTHTVQFNASVLASGVYFYRIQSGTFSLVKKMVLVK